MGKKILVVSDSHGDNTNLKKAIAHFGVRGSDLAMLIHLGDMQCEAERIQDLVDCPVEAVHGNCDAYSSLPENKMITIGNERAFLTHGHRYGCKSNLTLLREIARENGASLVLFGHTHVPFSDPYSAVKAFNPGSISYPRQEGRAPTYLVITVKEDKNLEFCLVTMQEGRRFA